MCYTLGAVIIECLNCRRLQADLEEAGARIATLEAELRRGHRQAAPFSRDEPKPDSKPPGRRLGQGRFIYLSGETPEEAVQQRVQVPLPACPECGGPLQDLKTHEQVQVDLPTVRPVVTRFVTQSGSCPCCCKRSHSCHPEQVSQATGAAGVSIGPRAKALATDMKHRLCIPYRKIANKAAFDLEVTAGGLCQADEQLARKAEPIYRELGEAIRRSAAVYAEETGWRMGVLSAWLWVFTSQKITLYTIDERRSHEVVVEIYRLPISLRAGEDCFSAYDHKGLKYWLKQKCFAHLLGELSLLEGEKKRRAVRISRELVGVLREALALGEEKGKMDEATFKGKVKEVEMKLDALLNSLLS